jgi:predicted RNA-binding protein with PIN domain
MALHIVIDGYNLIRQSERFSAIEDGSLEEGREALVASLVLYRRVKHHSVTVIFDGAYADQPLQRRIRHRGINIVFSRPGESADTVIKRMVMREGERAVVVSSDGDVVNFAARHGAVTIGSGEFEEKMQMATHDDIPQAHQTEGEGGGWTPTTKKKGPPRRPPKVRRKHSARKQKL